jgi:hypothetical protein
VKQQGAIKINQDNLAFQKWQTEMEIQGRIKVAEIAAGVKTQDTVADVETEFAWMRQEQSQHQDNMAHKTMDRGAQGITDAAGMIHKSFESAQQRAHDATQSGADRAFQHHQTSQGQAFQAQQSDADRAHQQQIAKNKPKPNGR